MAKKTQPGTLSKVLLRVKRYWAAMIGSIALSPRGDWRMPSDAQYKAWMDECDCIKA